jgi:integrase
MIKPKATTSIYLDKRIEKKGGLYPVKIRVTHKRKSRLYGTKYSLTKKEFKKAASGKGSNELKDTWLELGKLEKKAIKTIERMEVFSFDEFTERFKQTSINGNDVYASFEKKIDELKSEEKLKTSYTYECALNSIKKYRKERTLQYSQITMKFLKEYEKWMVEQGNSITTVGIYLRNLRHLMNNAIREGLIEQNQYPFGRGKYIIPQSRNIKKALSFYELKKLLEYQPEDGSREQFYLDMWLFSYLSNGINIKDICLMKYQDIKGDHIHIKREKTKSTNRNAMPIDIILVDRSREIIKRWGTKPTEPNNYIFPFLSNGMGQNQMIANISQVVKQTNKYVRRVAKKIGITEEISTYWARHSFATVLKRSGVPTSFISDSLGHSSTKVTEGYLDSFEDDAKKKILANLTELNIQQSIDQAM